MIYSEAMRFIENISRGGSDYGIERMRELLDLLGSPDDRLKVVHVAGTNGKGSVTAYLTSVLKTAGFRVGTYNSPSVFSYNERWLIDGAPLCDDAVARYMTAVKDAIDAENRSRSQKGLAPMQPTAFEIETALALLAFDDARCSVCVLETGLGGRWDATNAIHKKELAVITPIGLDHCELLGDTLGEIAGEKAAIIDGDAVTCEQTAEVMEQLRKPYRIINGERVFMPCRLTVAQKPVLLHRDLSGQDFMYGAEKFHIKMIGEHQLENASIAICALKKLAEKQFEISDEALRKGMAQAEWHARLEIIQNSQNRFDFVIPHGKTLVLDGAHNPHGAKTLGKAIADYFPSSKVHLVMGMLKDKDVDGVLGYIAPCISKATAVTPPSPRALDKELLKRKLDAYAPCETADDIHSAVQVALNGDCDVVLVAGSLTLFKELGGK